jgi:hypothetical protein
MSSPRRFTILPATAVAMMCLASAASAASGGAADPFAGTFRDADLTLAFDGNGHYRVTQKGTLQVEGTYAVDGDHVRFTDTGGPWACDAAQTGTYRWKADGSHLAFDKAADACKERVDGITPRPWTKEG